MLQGAANTDHPQFQGHHEQPRRRLQEGSYTVVPSSPDPTPDLGFPPVLGVRRTSQGRNDASKEEDDTCGCRRRPQKAGISPGLTVDPNVP
jgi:hypothetical protein